MLDVADIEHHQLCPERQIGGVADDDGRPVQPVAVRVCGVLRVRILQLQFRQPPPRYLYRMRWIRNIDVDVDLSEVASDGSSRVDVASAEIRVAVCSEAAGLPLAEAHRVHQILETPDHDPVVPRRIRISVTTHLRPLGRGYELSVGDVELAAARVLRTGNPVEDFGIGRIGDVEDAPAAVSLRAGIHVPATVHLLDVDLEREVAV